MISEGGQADVAFSAGAETYTGCSYYIGFV